MLQAEIREAISKVSAAASRGDRALADQRAAEENLAEVTQTVNGCRAECDASLTELANLLAKSAKPPVVDSEG